MALDPKFIDLVNEKNDIVSLVTENGIVLEKAGKNYKGLCPFHADTNPSFFVSPERNLCNCFTCKTGGNPVNFYMKIKNVSFVDSIIYLAARAGLEIPSDIKKTSVNDKFYKMYTLACAFYETILSSSEIGKVATNYLQKREITSKEIKKFHLGFSQTNNGLYNMLKSKGFTDNDILEAGLVVKNDNQTFIDLFRNRLMIPITDGYGRVVAFSGRLIEKNDNQPKYVNSPESPIFKKGKTVYNIFEASDEIRKNKSVIIMEGFFDLIQSYKAGIQNVVVMMGTSITPNHISLIKEKTESVLLAFDGDDAGAKAMIKAIPHFIKASLKLEILAFPDKLDPDEFIRQNGPENFEFLFQNNIYSPYAFIYSYYKRNLDVNDINSITTFKAGVSESFAHAEIIIKEQYQKQIFDELKINIDFSSKNQVSASNYNPTPPPSLPQFTKPNTIKETAHFNNKEFEKEVILLILYDNSKINEFSIDSVFASTDNYRYEIYKQIAYVISSKTLINLSNITTFIVNENYLETIKEILKDAWKISKNNCEKTLKRLLTQKDIIPLIRKIDELKKSGSSKSEEIAKINKAIDAIKLKSMNNKEKNGN